MTLYRNPQTREVHDVAEALEGFYDSHGWERVDGSGAEEASPPSDMSELLSDLADDEPKGKKGK